MRIAFGLALAAGLLSSCASIPQSTSERQFKQDFDHYTYCEVPVVRQASRQDCGAAALASLIAYWKEEPPSLRSCIDRLPAAGPHGHRIFDLRRTAQDQGLDAFVVSLKAKPFQELEKEITRGRPVLVPLQCPKGRYFGKRWPLVGVLDAEKVRFQVREEVVGGISLVPQGASTKEHFVLVIGFDGNRDQWLIIDPAYGIVSLPESRLGRFWQRANYTAMPSSLRDVP